MTYLGELTASRIRWAGLSGREHGDPGAGGPAFVFLHGLTFDRGMWDPVLDALPAGCRAIAFDLPGHGGSPAVGRRGLGPVVEAVHEAVLDAGVDAPVVVGHSIGGPIAAIYASEHPAAGVVSVEAPVRLEPFAETVRLLAGEGFDRAWDGFRASMRMNLLEPGQREYLRERPSRELVLRYQADLLERPLADVVRWRDEGMRRLRNAGTPYVTLHAAPVSAADRAFLAARLPQARVVVWPVGHHFPHLAEPDRFARLLRDLVASD